MYASGLTSDYASVSIHLFNRISGFPSPSISQFFSVLTFQTQYELESFAQAFYTEWLRFYLLVCCHVKQNVTDH